MTIVDPLVRATLVNPPFVTKILLPDNMNGLKSICLGSILVFIIEGLVESFINGWATKFLGLSIIFALYSSNSFFDAFGPIKIP